MRGQLDISFQWIYVVIAGGAFLLIFFFAFRAFSHSADERNEAVSLRAAADALSTAIWQQEGVQNMTVHADVSCVGGKLTLTSGEMNAQLPGVPVFMPPRLAGRTTAFTREVSLGREGIPTITYGNIVYIMDATTYYYVIGDIEVPGKNVVHVEDDELRTARVPDGATSIIIVTDTADLATVGLPPTKAATYGVALENGRARFYVRDGAALVFKRELTYIGDELKLGAIIAGTPQNYLCAKANFAQRARDITGIYARRSALLLDDLPQACGDEHRTAAAILRPGNEEPADDALLAAMRNPRLLAAQQTLYRLDCPVIA